MNMAARDWPISAGRRTGSYAPVKRGLDVLVSLAGLLCLWPFLLLIALLIVLDSPGAGPFFVQQRVGKHGRTFKMVKFRTMVPNAEGLLSELLEQNEMDGPVFKMHRDPRVTRFGRFLRRYCLDELPQLVNVLRGEMSLVGPRPGLPREAEHYDEAARLRLQATPGMTCYWQITPDRNDLSFEEWMELDRKYMGEQCLSVDLRILLATVKVVLGGKGI